VVYLSCGVSECDREALKMRKPWPARDCRGVKNNYMRITVQTTSGGDFSDLYSGVENFESWPRQLLS